MAHLIADKIIVLEDKKNMGRCKIQFCNDPCKRFSTFTKVAVDNGKR